MRVIAVSTLKAFWEQPAHRDAEQPLKAWFEEACTAVWQQPADVKARFGNASILKNRRVVFNIKGNDDRLVVAVRYTSTMMFLRFVGTHAEYDRIDAETI